uniref:Uncharacterized protein n=1 Tax=Arundo donax TaxID=35708 RepID=A0A0A8YWV5_ARUDO
MMDVSPSTTLVPHTTITLRSLFFLLMS